MPHPNKPRAARPNTPTKRKSKPKSGGRSSGSGQGLRDIVTKVKGKQSRITPEQLAQVQGRQPNQSLARQSVASNAQITLGTSGGSSTEQPKTIGERLSSPSSFASSVIEGATKGLPEGTSPLDFIPGGGAVAGGVRLVGQASKFVAQQNAAQIALKQLSTVTKIFRREGSKISAQKWAQVGNTGLNKLKVKPASKPIVNTVTKTLFQKYWLATAAVAVPITVAGFVVSYGFQSIWGDDDINDALKGVNIAMRDAQEFFEQTGDPSAIQELDLVYDGILAVEQDDNIGFFKGGYAKKLEGLEILRDTQKQIIQVRQYMNQQQFTAIQNRETPEETSARITQERVTTQEAIQEVIERSIAEGRALDLEHEKLKGAVFDDRRAHNRLLDIQQQIEINKLNEKAALEQADLIAKFWREYNKQKSLDFQNNTPSVLNFGLL